MVKIMAMAMIRTRKKAMKEEKVKSNQ